ncbi:MAG: FecR domain-containing protein [Anaerolineales bacterium]|nr:FecR domain-containing protein [Anaerolineales bacterium]
MTDLEELLQQRLEQLEAGAPLADCQKGLPPEEAALLQLAAELRQVEAPVRSAAQVAGQRAQIMALTDETATTPGSLLTAVIAWLTARPLAAGGLALAAVVVLILVIGLWPHPSAPNGSLAEKPPVSTDPSVPTAILPQTAETSAAVGASDTAVSEPAAVAAIPTQAGLSVFLPAISSPLVTRPDQAALQDVRGLVEVQNEDGSWTAVMHSALVHAGQSLRTGSLSSASLLFHDGSQAVLGPQSEIAIAELNALPPGDGFRTVILRQQQGESHHQVAFRGDNGSRYEVQTPTGSGIARGTRFDVSVPTAAPARFTVTEGRVEVSQANRTVSVSAGQTTSLSENEPPTDPAFLVTGQGEVTAIGPDAWTIAGQTFAVNASTVISGDPQIGDVVYVAGHLAADGSRVADHITLVYTPPLNQFMLTGAVEAIGAESWQVAGQPIAVDENTAVAEGIDVGDQVRVTGLIQEDGTLLATAVTILADEETLPFDFTGVVQTIGPDTWAVSGVVITVNGDTAVDAGIAVGDTVRVQGHIVEGNVWLAENIVLVSAEEATFTITGPVESIDPWRVAGIDFTVTAGTLIAPDIALGDLVRVNGRILPTGVWVADSIEKLDDESWLEIVFVGTVDGMDPWVVSGLPLVTNEQTLIDEGINIGDLVRVTARIRPDGTWLAVRIYLLDTEVGESCVTVTAVVTQIINNQITLSDGTVITLTDALNVTGDLQVGSVVAIIACVNEDGTITITEIIVIYNPVLPPTPTPPAPGPTPPPPPPSGNGNVTICHKPGSPAQQTKTVPQSALGGHLGHGDTLGPCP